MLAPAVQRHLRSSGHSGREYAPYMARVIGSDALPPPPERAADEGWMIPMVELRRLLEEARAAGKSFSLTFRARASSNEVHVPGGGGDAWRRVRVDHISGAAQQCIVLDSRWWWARSLCPPEEARLLATAPPPWAMSWLLFFPFPMKLSDGLSEATHETGCLS